MKDAFGFLLLTLNLLFSLIHCNAFEEGGLAAGKEYSAKVNRGRVKRQFGEGNIPGLGYFPPSTTTTAGYFPPSSTAGYFPPSSTSGYFPPSSTFGYFPPSSTSGYFPPSTTSGPGQYPGSPGACNYRGPGFLRRFIGRGRICYNIPYYGYGGSGGTGGGMGYQFYSGTGYGK